MQTKIELPLEKKYTLTIREAAVYFNIGEKRLRRIAEDHIGEIALFSGNKILILRAKFEEFICSLPEI